MSGIKSFKNGDRVINVNTSSSSIDKGKIGTVIDCTEVFEHNYLRITIRYDDDSIKKPAIVILEKYTKLHKVLQ